MKFTKKQQGVISVFLSLILLLTFLFSGVVIDGGRIYAARNIVSGAGQLSLNAGLSNYDTALKDAYGLIAMSETPEELETNLKTYFVDSLSSCGITEEDYNTALVFLEIAASEESFSAKGVENTQICQGYVMEQQVLDYMKYRAPITMGTEIIDKLKSTKDMEEAKVVANDEVETSKALSDVEKHLKKLKDLVDDEIGDCYGFRNTWKSTLEEIEKLCKEITAGELAVAGYIKYGYASQETDWEKLIKSFNESTGKLREAMAKGDATERYTAAYDVLIEMQGYYLNLKDVSENDFMDYWKANNGLNETSESAEEESDEGEKVDDGAAAAAVILQEGKQLYQDYTTNKRYFEEVPTQIDNQVKNNLNLVSEKSKSLYESAKECMKREQKVIDQIDKVRKKLKKMGKKLDKWERDSGNLSNAELRSQTEKNQESYKKLIDEDEGIEAQGIGIMESYAENNKDFFEQFMKYVDDATFCDVQLKKVSQNKDSVKSTIDTHVANVENAGKLSSFINSTNFDYLLPMANPAAEFKHEELKDLSATEFYAYLEKCYGAKKNQSEIDQKNEKMQDSLDTLLTELNNFFTSNDIKGVATKLQSIQGELPSTMMKKGNVATKKDVKNENTNLDDSDKREKSMDNALDTLNKDNDNLKGMVNLANKASEGIQSIIEPVYITEYVMNMYSYYTIAKTGEKENGKWGTKKKEEIVSLSNYKLYEDLIYRAEAEYILWGNKEDVTKNVGSTKAVIFAIHFIGNLIYALTQADVTTGAAEIGSLFVNPIIATLVQVVVEIVVATVETVRDMIILQNGGAVVPFKLVTQGEWKTPLKSAAALGSWNIAEDKSSGKPTAFTYKDYLWMFLCIKCIGDGRYEVLARCADLSQANIANAGNLKGYKLMDEYTMLKIDADVKMDTWLVTDLFAPEKAGLDTSGTFTLKYKGIQGY